MWRSNARVFLIRSSKQIAPSSKTKVSSNTVTLISSQSPRSSAWAFPRSSQFQNPRFFSHNSDPFDNVIDKKSDDFGKNPTSISLQSHISSLDFETMNTENAKNNIFEENPFFVSHESDVSSVIFKDGAEKDDVFGENPSFVFEESVICSMVSSNGMDKDDIDNENPSLSLQEDGDQMGSEETLDEIPGISVEQVENVLSVLQSSLDGPLESSLDELGLTDLSEEFIVRVIQTPHVLGENLIGFFKWASKTSDFVTSTRVIDCLVRSVSVGRRKKEAYSLWDLVKDIGVKEKGLITTEIANQLISLFWKLRKGKAALEVFSNFDEFGCKPDEDTYYLTIEALCGRSMFDVAWSVCEKMINSGNLPDSEKIGKIIAGLCKGSKAKDAHLVYLIAKENNKHPPRSTMNFLISKLCGDDETVCIAAELLEDFSGEARKYAIKPYTSVIYGLCRIKDVKEAKKLLFRMIDSGPPPGNSVFNSVIKCLSKAGDMEEAIELMKVMESRGLRPDVYTYSVIMSGFVNGGQMDDACRIFSEAKKTHSKLSPVAYHILIRGYCKMEEFDKALKFLREMREYGVRPSVDEYNKLIQSLCLKALDWHAAEKLLEEMKESGLYLNGITRGLITAVKNMELEALKSEGVIIAG
ncbi:tetratricopeptide repeat (TPR)-like superfamily protein [Tasmannia lanceolata]|uniref:tetratricopeptide repeat (TPR)-like superfamily protein n=1 Tax=Tasmannia lanceolata TaxID=3420 RepID=UPI0040644844